MHEKQKNRGHMPTLALVKMDECSETHKERLLDLAAESHEARKECDVVVAP